LSIPYRLMINAYNIRHNSWPELITFNNIEEQYEAMEPFDEGDQWNTNSVLLYVFLIKLKKLLGLDLSQTNVAVDESDFSNEALAKLSDSDKIALYVRHLPRDFSGLPIWMNDEELDLLKGTSLHTGTTRLIQKLTEFYGWLNELPLVKDDDILSKGFTLQELKWAYSVVWSRVFPIRVPRENSPVAPALLPFVDSMNHKSGAKRTYFADYDNKTFVIKADEDITEVGSEVFNNYGAKCNSSFLFSYGFVVPNNANDMYFIQLGFSTILDPFPRKVLKEWNRDILNRQFRFYIQSGRPIPDELWKTLRVCLMNDQEQYFLSQHQDTENRLGFISFRNELESLATLRRLFVQRLNSMPFDMLEDWKELETLEPFTNKFNILTYRSSQQKIVMECIDEIDKKLDVLHRNFFTLTKDKKIISTDESIVQDWSQFSEFLPNTMKAKKHGMTIEDPSTVKDNVVGRIPHTHILHTSTFTATEVGYFLHETCDITNTRTLLQIWIMIQRFVQPTLGADDHWVRFFSLFPSNFCSLVEKVFLDPQASPEDPTETAVDLLDAIEDVIGEITSQSNYVSRKLSESQSKFSNLSEEAQAILLELTKTMNDKNVLWAYLARNYCQVPSDYGEVLVAFPFTLQQRPNTFLASDETSNVLQLNIRAADDYATICVSGENWMRCDNRDLLMTHGCLLQHNPLESICINLDMPQLREGKRKKVLREMNMDNEHHFDWNHEPIKFMNTVCVAYMNDDELKVDHPVGVVWAHLKAFEEARKYALDVLGGLMSNTTYSGNNRLITSYVNSQKKLIHQNMRKISKFKLSDSSDDNEEEEEEEEEE